MKVQCVEIKAFRTANNLEQKEVAEYLGVTRQQISQIENGKSGLSKENIRKLLSNPYGWDVSMLPKDPMSVVGSVVINGSNKLNNSTKHQDNRQYYSDSPDVLRAQIELLDERIKEKDAQIKEKDAQINRLLDLLSDRK